MSGLVLHSGAWTATREGVDAVAVPAATRTYAPIAHGALIDTVKDAAPRYGLQLVSEQYALARDGAQLFGVLNYGRPAMVGDPGELGLAVGLRNSYDESMSVGLVAGDKVFICDNLAFSGDWCKVRKHTPNAWRDLAAFLYLEGFPSILERHAESQRLSARLRGWLLGQRDADHLAVEAARRGALIPGDILPVLKEYAAPTVDAWNAEPRNAWRLYNAVTQRAKAWSAPLQMERTRVLGAMFTEVCPN